ncbi:MAG: anthranilate synthase component I family protein [Euryarchaeota archaeon]|nr:anthranilate synthase component I family protein [Euryarchaeota archaeon]
MIVRELPIREGPLELFERILAAYDEAYLLQSAEGPKRFSKYSFIGFAPAGKVSLHHGRLRKTGAAQDVAPDAETFDEVLRSLLSAFHPTESHLRFLGGLVGYTTYEYVRGLEKVPDNGDSGFPLLEYGLFLDGITYLHDEGKVVYVSVADDRSDEIAHLPPAKKDSLHVSALRCDTSETRFHKMVDAAKGRIHDGEVFQVVLSKGFEAGFSGNLLEFYKGLLKINPSPYMHYMKFADREVIGTSPEMLVQVEGDTVATYPIAGTRPLGKTAAETEGLKRDLLSDKKELAEHSMLVDLARNDVGRVSEYGSVRVPELMKVERFSHVQHIVSRVEGKLRNGFDCLDAYDAIFPAGTVTGAPKVRAMEIIARLEAAPRGPYAGSVGYFSLNGNLDSAITIRTLAARRGKLRVQAGAGIVADSTPEGEWAETEAKAKALTSVLEGFG